MRDTRRARIGTLFAVCALAVMAGIAARYQLARRDAAVAAIAPAGEDLRDAVASPVSPLIARAGGKSVPVSWFKTPESRRAEMDSALLASRRRRALVARRVAVQ